MEKLKKSTTIYSPRRPSSVEESKIMEFGLRLQIEKLEAKLKPYRRDNEELRDTNTNSEVIIKIHEIQKELKEQKISDEKNHIEKLSAQIEKLKSENDFNQRLKNQDKKKERKEKGYLT